MVDIQEKELEHSIRYQQTSKYVAIYKKHSIKKCHGRIRVFNYINF